VWTVDRPGQMVGPSTTVPERSASRLSLSPFGICHTQPGLQGTKSGASHTCAKEDNIYNNCRRFDPGGSLDRRVNCRRVSQPRWVGARRSTKGGETAKGEPAASVLSCAQVGCACSRGLQAFARESERERLSASPFSRAANLLVREPWTFLL
jgi:hypothetical protein